MILLRPVKTGSLGRTTCSERAEGRGESTDLSGVILFSRRLLSCVLITCDHNVAC